MESSESTVCSETGTPSPTMHDLHVEIHPRVFVEESTNELCQGPSGLVRNVQIGRYFRHSHLGAHSGNTTPQPNSQQPTRPLALDKPIEVNPILDETSHSQIELALQDIRCRREASKHWQKAVNRQLLVTATVMLSSTILYTRNKAAIFDAQSIQMVESAATALGLLESNTYLPRPSLITMLEASLWFTYMSLVCGILTSMLGLWIRHRLNLCITSSLSVNPTHRPSHIRRHFLKLQSQSIPSIINYLPILPSISTILLLAGVALTCATFNIPLALLSVAVVVACSTSTILQIKDVYEQKNPSLPLVM